MVHVAILGFGVVGSGVAEVLEKNTEKIAFSAAAEISLKYILDLQDFPGSPFADRVIHDFKRIEQDPEIQIVVETIGGTGVAYEFTKRCLLAGKSVVTSNKELVAIHGYELLSIAVENNLNYFFEASVGGGIPIVRPLCQCLAANEISEVYGILNGTTNYILSHMAAGVDFDSALRQAQELGYAEADPTADIAGHDACRKICILGSLSFGHHIHPDQVYTEGIDKVALQDIYYAKQAGWRIKLLGRAIRRAGDTVAVYVAPHLVSTESILANVDDVFNGIMVKGNAIGDVMFYGPGAGKLPTASAVVADIIDCAKHFHARKYIDWLEGDSRFVADPRALVTRWYVRTPPGGEKAFGQVDLLSCAETAPADTVFLTPPMSQVEIQPKLEATNAICAFRVLE